MSNMFSTSFSDDLPNDLEVLKARIYRQTILIGYQLVELDDLREDMQKLKRQNRQLIALLTPPN